jgi:glycosyltransferase involved in cell wall biosynthesis
VRVLYLVGTLGVGGLERFVTRVALRAKSGQEFVPIVCCLHEPKGPLRAHLDAAGVQVYGAPHGWARQIRPLIDCSRLIRAIDPDVVHSQVNFALCQQFLAVRAANRAAFCVTERSCYRRRGFARVRRVLQFHLIRGCGTHYSANSAAVAKHLARMVGVPVRSVPVLPNGVLAIPPDATVRTRIRKELGWEATDIGLGYVARIVAEKGHAEFVSAVNALRMAGLPVRACLAGDGPARPTIERLVNTLGLAPSVSFVGTVPNVEEYLQAFDIVALFSSREGMPNAILEAMAAGKAIVATAVGAIPELLDEGRAGAVVYQPTERNLTSALAGLVEDRKQREQLGCAALQRANTLFCFEQAYATLLQHYQQVV